MDNPEQITFFAKTDARGQEVPFGIKAKDRTRHIYVIGKTGMGKSTLLENMAVQDIKNGNGLAFIDPHGQTAETLLDYIPEERIDDVVYFAPFDTDNPVSFNVMEDVGPDKRHLVVSGLMSVFKKIWVDAWSARMEYILSNTLLALLEYPDSTLLGVNRMLSDKEYRMRVIENITDPAVKSFWVDEFLKYNERYMQEAGDAIKNKIGQFTSNPLIRNIIGQPHSSFDIRKIMDDKKILIMNLSKGLVGEQNANLLGSMLTTRIYLAAMSRADRTAEEMKAAPNFYFYVDEFQSFANATFADILSEARKYKLNLTIAHQYIEQMEEEVRNAVFGNVGTIISFRVGPFDAEVLETVYTPTFLAPDIVNLGFAQVYLTLMIDGIGSAPFSASTLPPIELSGESYKGVVVKRSRELYTKKREGVEETIHAWHAQNFSNKPPYVPKHLREAADGGELPNTGENLKKYGPTGGPNKEGNNKNTSNNNSSKPYVKKDDSSKPAPRTQGRDTTPRNNTSARPQTNNRTNTQDNTRTNTQDDTRSKAPAPRVETKSAPERKPAATFEPDSEQSQSKKERNLEELRAVLQGISGNSNTEKKDADTSADSASEEAKKKSKEASLKEALALALGKTTTANKTGKKEETKGQTEVTNDQHETKKIRTDNASQASHSAPATRPEGKTEELTPSQEQDKQKGISYTEVKNIDDPLSPKKLERMMRVNAADKPPIK